MKIKCLLKDGEGNSIEGHIIAFIKEIHYTEAVIVKKDGHICTRHIYEVTITDKDYV